MTKATPTRSYTGEDVYIGIDVHKKSYVLEARVGQARVKRWTTPALPQKLPEQLLKYFDGGRIHSAYEAGFSGFVLHRSLSQAGIDSRVVHAAAIEVAAHNRVKTDKRDARKLATQLEAGRLKAIYIPTEAEEQARLLSRTRKQLANERGSLKRKIRMKAHQFGLIGPEDNRQMTHKMVTEILEKSPGEEFTLAIEVSWAVWRTLDEQIARLEARAKQQAEADPNEAVYRSSPGFGPISSRVCSNELGNLKRFSNEGKLFSYTGLTPGEESSGETVHRGPITKQGNRHIRAVLIEVAWRAIRQDSSLARFYQKVSSRAGAKRAIVAVARKLIGRVRAAFCKGELYHIADDAPPQATDNPPAQVASA